MLNNEHRAKSVRWYVVYVPGSVHVHVHVHVHAYVYVYAYAHAHVCVCTGICVYMHAYMCA